MSSSTGRINAVDLPQVIENLKSMEIAHVAMAYRSSDFNLYSDSVMMLTLTELKRREKRTVPEEIAKILKQGLEMINQEIYASEPYNQAEQYADVAAALKWLEGAK